MADLRILTGVKIADADTPANSVTVTAGGALTAILASNTGVDIGDVDVLSLPTSPDTIAEDTAFSAGAAVFPMGAQFDDAAPNVLDEGDIGAPRVSNNRNLYTTLRDAAGNERGANVTASNELSVLASAQPGVDIGDVDVLSVTPGNGAALLGKAEDAASAAGDTLVAVAAVQDATLSALGSIDGDYTQLRVNANGALWVETVGASGGTSATDDALFTTGTDSYTPVGGIFDDTAPNNLEENDGGVVRMTANRAMHSVIRDAAGNERGVNVTASNELQVLASAQPGVDIGDVDILSVIPGVGATNLGKAENAASAAGDTLVAVAAVQDTTLSALGSIDGDYTQLRVNANGALWVEQVAGGSGTSAVDDAAFTTGTDSYTPVGGIFDDTAPNNLEENDGGVVRMTANRAMHSVIRDGAGNERSANVTASNELNVLASAQPGVDIGDVTVNGFAAADTDADDDVVAAAQTSLRTINLLYGYDGTQWERLQTDASGALDVNITSGGGEALPTNPVRTTSNSTDTAAASTFTLDGPSSDGTTTKVRAFDVSASVAVKAELQTVENGAGTTVLTQFAQAGEPLSWKAPHRNFFSKAHPSNAGFDGWRIVVTNLDNENAANLYATLYTED